MNRLKKHINVYLSENGFVESPYNGQYNGYSWYNATMRFSDHWISIKLVDGWDIEMKGLDRNYLYLGENIADGVYRFTGFKMPKHKQPQAKPYRSPFPQMIRLKNLEKEKATSKKCLESLRAIHAAIHDKANNIDIPNALRSRLGNAIGSNSIYEYQYNRLIEELAKYVSSNHLTLIK